MNVVDRIVGFFDPQAGMRRHVARNALDRMAQRTYAAAQDSRTRDGWIAGSTGANSEIGRSVVQTRNRVRQLDRDDSLATRIINLWVAHLIGDGITLSWVGAWAAKRDEVWLKWFETTQCDADGHLDGYGLQALAARIMVQAGGVVIRKRYRDPQVKAYAHLAVPMQLQVLEPDYIDMGKSGTNPLNGNPIIQGIEFAKFNPSLKVAYWLFTEHPGDATFNFGRNRDSIRVPAEEVIYMHRKERQQVHGMSWLHAVTTRLRDLDEYFEALMTKAKMEACYTVFIEDDFVEGPSQPGQQQQQNDFELEPGIVRFLKRGQKANAFEPSNSTGHSVLVQTFIRFIAIGVGLTYDQAYSDLTGANYSSLRAGKNEFATIRSQYQWQTVIPGMVEPIAGWFVEAGYLKGLWPSKHFESGMIDVTPPPLQLVDPKKDGDADRAELDYGGKTFADYLRARGLNPKRHMKQLLEEFKTFKEAGLVHPMMEKLGIKTLEASATQAADKAVQASEKRMVDAITSNLIEHLEEAA
jgi:lambda family phage portal protein